MFVAYAAVLLYFVSLGRSAPTACEDLLRPLDQQPDPGYLNGTRAMVAGSLSHAPLMERLQLRESATASFQGDHPGSLTFRRSLLMDGSCSYVSYNVSLEGSSFSLAGASGNITTTFVRTSCPDCVLLSFDLESGVRRHFYLFSRRRQLEPEEMEEFKAQVECQKMPPPAVMDPTKELCPPEEEAAAQTQEEAEAQKKD